MEEAHGIGEGILDEHTLRVPRDELGGGRAPVVRQEDRRLLVPQVQQVELAEGPASQPDRLLVDTRGAVGAGGDIQLDVNRGRS
jgi:hypothetical protein